MGISVKRSGAWVGPENNGDLRIKSGGAWRYPTKIYVKRNGYWVDSAYHGPTAVPSLTATNGYVERVILGGYSPDPNTQYIVFNYGYGDYWVAVSSGYASFVVQPLYPGQEIYAQARTYWDGAYSAWSSQVWGAAGTSPYDPS